MSLKLGKESVAGHIPCLFFLKSYENLTRILYGNRPLIRCVRTVNRERTASHLNLEPFQILPINL